MRCLMSEASSDHRRDATIGRRARPMLGTLVEISVDGVCHAQAFDAAFAAIEAVEATMSRWREHSDVTRLNRALPGEPVVVAPLTRRVLRLALRLHRASAGLFDCAIAGTLAHLAIGGDGRVTKREPLAIDLGGIAKGEAVDQAVGALRRAGVRRALVNAGGDLRAFGRGEFRVVLRDPHDPDRRAAALCLNDAALASSSACYANAPGRSAIADPRNGQPVLMRHGVTVMAPRCALADALTKVVAVSDDAHHPLLARFGAQAWIIH